VILIGLQALTLIGILLTSRHNTEVMLRDHAQAAMMYSAEAIADNTLRYLSPAERAAKLTEDLLVHDSLNISRPEQLETYFFTQLRSNAELSSIYLGQPNGDFFFVKKDGEGFFTKIIRSSPQRNVIYRYHNQNFELTQESLHPEDAFDPRTRPWYQQAIAENQPSWTDPYIFFTSKRPGITTSRPVYLSKNFLGVVSVDIEISGLSEFLETIPISQHGSAFIMNHDGLAIAFPGLEDAMQDADTLPQVSIVGNDAARALLTQIPVDTLSQKSFDEFSVSDLSQYGLLSPFGLGDKEWLTGIYAPTADFQGQIQSRYRSDLFRILAIGIVVCLLAIPLIFGITRPLTRLYEQATRDELTQLPNRSEFLRKAKVQLLQAQRKGEQVAVAMFDLDGFKQVNDTYGHKAGDQVLSMIGQRLSAVVRAGDLVGRLGGDEFALLLIGVKEPEALHLVERIRNSIVQEPIRSDDEVYIIGATAGVAMNQHRENLLESLAKADQALLDAKSTGKNCTYVFSSLSGVQTLTPESAGI
jgi:diguanylate cyclase (GGDEF)-like protein